MNKFLIAAILLAAGADVASAQDLTSKVMKDHPGVTGGASTFNPTSKPYSGSLADKAMRDLPGISNGGRTANPTAKPISGSLSDKAMKDALARG